MKNVLCFGDSNTWGFVPEGPDPGVSRRLPYGVRWPGRLQSILGDGYRIVEDALNGRTITSFDPTAPNRTGMDHLRIALDAHAPLDLVILALGCNEFKDAFGRTAEEIAGGIGQMIPVIRQSFYGFPAPRILVLAAAPVPEEIADGLVGARFGRRSARVSREVGRRCREVAEKNGCAFLDCGELGLKLNDRDFLHYCAEDHAKVAEALAPLVREMLER